MKRYIELKTDGNIITDKIKIEQILIDKNFRWVLDAEIANARLEITKDTLIWNSGIWYNGDWFYGVFRNGEWKSGLWKNGVWYNGTFKDGVFDSGLIFNGEFINGEIKCGEIRGGRFLNTKISKYVKRTDIKKEVEPNNIDINIEETGVKLEHIITKFKDFLFD